MKKISYLLSALFLLLTFSACCEHGDYDVEYNAIAPIGGHYVVMVYEEDETPAEATLSNEEFWANHTCSDANRYVSDYAYLVNTTDNSSSQAWIRVGSLTAKKVYNITAKVSIDMGAYTFGGTNIMNVAGNVATSNTKCTVSGFVKKNDYTTKNSGTVTDRIEFVYSNTAAPGKRFKAIGYKYTGWDEDDI